MKTGNFSRMDDLGRVVIPKEIRRKIGLKEGSPLEIYIDDDGNLVFKKYEPESDIFQKIKQDIDELEVKYGYTIDISILNKAVEQIKKRQEEKNS